VLYRIENRESHPFMIRLFSGMLVSLMLLSACEPETKLAADGKPAPKVFRIGVAQQSKIQFRTLDTINAFRNAKGVQLVELSAELTAAAATHSLDMSVQNRPWHFGSDGSSPIDRVERAGYAGRMLGENISETFESDSETLSAWMLDPNTRSAILDPDATHIGISWYQEVSGKIWWTLIIGSSNSQAGQASG